MESDRRSTRDTVTLLGTGDMGSALARASLAAGLDVTVFNRTAAKANALVKAGARLAESVEDALAASDLIVVCVIDYEATRSLLQHDPIAERLRGKTLVQLSTGSPAEAEALGEWAAANRVAYLDGAIDAYTHQIGTDQGLLRLSGSRGVFDALGERLSHLGAVSHFTENVGAANALACGVVICLLGTLWGYLHGAAICAAHGIGAADFAAERLKTYLQDGELLTDMGSRIDACNYAATEASVFVYRDFLARILSASRDAGVATPVADELMRLFDEALDRDLAESDIAELYELVKPMRPGPSSPR